MGRKWVSGGPGHGRPGEFFSFGAELGGTKLLSGQMGSVHRRLLLLPQPLKNIPKVIRCNPSLYSDICLSRHTIPPTPVDHPSGTQALSSFTRHCFENGEESRFISHQIKLPPRMFYVQINIRKRLDGVTPTLPPLHAINRTEQPSRLSENLQN